MKQSTLIISNHHRRSYLFEQTMNMLWNNGYQNILIHDTGNCTWGKYQGKCSEYKELGWISYDQGMIEFKKRIDTSKYKRIIMLDNDLFLSDINHFEKYLSEFITDKYDFACHHVSADCYKDYIYQQDNCITLLDKQDFIPTDVYPGFVPNPHWENAYLIITTELFNKISQDDISHGRKWIKAMARENARMGAHKANYKLIYSHYGPEWFHVGNLFGYYYRLENQQEFNPESTLDMSRLGYFFHQESFCPGITPNGLLDKYKDFETVALKKWNELDTTIYSINY